MKYIAAAFATLVISATLANADPLEGTWQTEPDDGAYAHIEIAPCGDKFCGKIARTFKDGAEYQSDKGAGCRNLETR